MEEWKEYKIADICNIKHGFAFKGQYFTETEQNYICVTPGNFGIKGGFKLDKPKYYYGPIPKDYILHADDLIVTMTDLSKDGDTLGYSALIPQNSNYIFLHNQRIGLIEKISPEIDKHFLYWIMRTYNYQKYIVNHCSGSTVKHTSPTNIGSYVFKAPSLEKQKNLVSFLDNIETKIELNRRINENLEQQAQALFKSWFIDFEPFKDGKFVDSELGMIPEELTISHIGDIPHTIESGKRPKGGAVLNGVPSIGAENIKGLGYYDYSKTKYIPEDFALTTNRGKINGYELLIYKDGGKPGYFIPNYTIFGEGFPFDEMFINEHVFRLDLMSKEYNVFAYFYMQTPYIMNQLNSIGGKAAIPGINTKDVESLPIFTEDNKKIKEFGNLVLPMITTILRNCHENARLAQLRDTLLPRLMSGELEIKDNSYD